MNLIETEVRGHVLLITLNRPEARNAFNQAMAKAMEGVLDAYDSDSALRCAVLKATGPTFSAGQDLISAPKEGLAATERRGVFGIMARPPEKPLIAAVEGQALAGGMELTLCCDLIVASTAAVFGLAEARRGLVAVGGGCFRLPRRIPYHIAMEMILTAEPKSAEVMHQLGYVNSVVAPGQVMDEALRLGTLIALNGPLAVKASKAIAARSAAETWSETEAWRVQSDLFAPVQRSTDLREGLTAFAEKRPPVWTGS